MNAPATFQAPPTDTRARLLEAAKTLMRTKGYHATSVDELCGAAGVTKGAFFHHFPTKEALGVAAADYWSSITGAMFATAPYHDHDDPLDRIMAYLDFRLTLLNGPIEAATCYAGTVVQETFHTSEAIRAACKASIWDHAARLESDIAEAMAAHGVTGTSAHSLALHTQAVVQGAFIMAKAADDMNVAVDSVTHLKTYFNHVFHHPREN